jgi:cellulose synthase (UDP-forming)
MNFPTADQAPQGRVNHLKAKPANELSWRPIQRSTRFVVFIALGVTLFYAIFLLNPAYRGDTWV